MPKRKLGALEKVDADLPNLQHKIRRDPTSYIEEFRSQYLQYENHREIFVAGPTSASERGIVSLRDLIDFISHVADCYPDITERFPQDLIDVFSQHHALLDPDLREKIAGSLVLLRKKNLLDSTLLLQTFFPILISTASKSLRSLLFKKIISDLRASNAKATNHKLNRTAQTLLYNLLTSDRTSVQGLWPVRIAHELWRRQIWTDTKTVEIMKEAALSEHERVIVGGVRFFLGGDKEREEFEDEDSDEDGVDMGKLRHQMGINKKSKKSTKALSKAAATVKKREKRKQQPHLLNFSALHLLHDPQGFAETLFSKHLLKPKSSLSLEQKLLVLQLVSRLIGLHKLTILSFYSFFIKYLTPRQTSVTTFLACLAQSAHDLVPPDCLEPLIQKIANEFVSEAAAGEVASAGLNAIREICVRQPLAMNETLLQDLVMYKKSKEKGVMMASKGLLSLYREKGADMLKKRDRGKEAALNLRSEQYKPQRYGEVPAGEIEGLDLLEKWKAEERARKRLEQDLASNASDKGEAESDQDDWDAWNVEENDSDDSGGWINVESDKEIDISDDSGNESVSKKRAKYQPTADDGDGPKSDSPEKPSATTSSSLATSRILTPADLAKLQELRNQAAIDAQLRKAGHQNHHHHKPGYQPLSSSTLKNPHRHIDDPLTSAEIEGLAALSKGRPTRDEKIAASKENKTDRLNADDDRSQRHRSKAARKKERMREAGKSTTNKEKARKKNFLMTLSKAKRNEKGKGKISLVETKKVLQQANSQRSRGKNRIKGGGKKGKR